MCASHNDWCCFDSKPSALLVVQELKHYSQALQDLQQALNIEPGNKAFAKELERLKQDCAEHRKQRAVLKQLNNSSGSSNISTSADSRDSAAQSVADQADADAARAQHNVEQADDSSSAGPLTELHNMKKMVSELQKQLARKASNWHVCHLSCELSEQSSLTWAGNTLSVFGL